LAVHLGIRDNFAAVEQMADHSEAALLKIAARKEDYALSGAASIAVAKGEYANLGVHPFVKDFVGLKLHFGEVDGACGGWWHPRPVCAKGCFFDFDRFKGVLLCISGFIGYKFKQKLWEAQKELIKNGVATHGIGRMRLKNIFETLRGLKGKRGDG
jgi:hypothetical protein